jgi:archaetidylinositol phosphate synthase
MVLNKYRGIAEKILTPVARAFSGLHPNTISAVSLLFALLAGIAFVFADKSAFEDYFKPGRYIYIMFAIASICVFLNGFFDAVDGHVARMTKRISKRGDFFDHALDRYADIFILGGIMLSPYCNSVLGALAIIAVLMTSYMGTQAQALGCGRDYSGLLGRADRLVILIIVPLLQMGVNYFIPSGRLPLPGIFSLTILEYTMIWFFIAGNITAIHRGIQSWRELRELEQPQKKLDHYFEISASAPKPRTKPKSSSKSVPARMNPPRHPKKSKLKPKPSLKNVPARTNPPRRPKKSKLKPKPKQKQKPKTPRKAPVKVKHPRKIKTKPVKKPKRTHPHHTSEIEIVWDDHKPAPKKRLAQKSK